MGQQLCLSFFAFFIWMGIGTAQEEASKEIAYEVNQVYQPLSISKEQLDKAETLMDLNAQYKPSWIKKYYSVKLWAKQGGKLKKVVGKNAFLTLKQKNLLQQADVGTDIMVEVDYLPNNTLKHNEPKTINFSFLVNPETSAMYAGGDDGLKAYLKTHAMDKIQVLDFDKTRLAVVKFAIDENGEVQHAAIVETSKNKTVDALLIAAIAQMPKWQPAQYANGMAVKQEFVLTVGNLESCVMNLLNVRRK